jgi:phosphoglycolate phosphatase
MTAVAAAVLFDMDGCLLDSRRGITTSMRHALVSAGHADRDPTDLEQIIGPPMTYTMHQLTGAAIGSPENDALVAGYRAHYSETLVAGTSVFAGIPDALTALAAAGHPLAVATSKPLTFAETLLSSLGLRDLFAHVAAPDFSVRTPDKAQLVRESLSALSATTSIMVGDRKFDIAGGAANGTSTIGVLWGFGSRSELTEAGADALVTTADELPSTVAALLASR